MKHILFSILFIILSFLNVLPKKLNLSGTSKVNINKYSETTETINNPGAGYTHTVWLPVKPGETPIYNPLGNLVLLLVCLKGFSSGMNGDKDYDLDDTFFKNLRSTLGNVRTNGGTLALRFRYDDVGQANPEPSSFAQMQKHIDQIKNSGILEEYKDILMFVESGFVGAWGEQHSGKYCSIEDKARTLESVLNMTPDDIPVTVRVPHTFAHWAGIPIDEIDTYVSVKGTKAARVGMYNDGYMGSDSDLGTFSDREKQTKWLENQDRYTYYGGEFSGNLEFTQLYNTYLPENSIREMYQTHLSYINNNIYELYKNFTFSSRLSVDNVDNSAYYGQTVWKFMRDHLGYRLVLRYSEIASQIEQGGTFNIKLKIENTGFASPIREQKAEIILEKDGNYIKTQVDIDSTQFFSCETHEVNLEMKIPGGIEEGKWNIYIKLSVGKSNINDFYLRSVKFANPGIWNGRLGANKIGTINIARNGNQALLANYQFYQVNTEKDLKSNGILLTNRNSVIIDGIKTGEMEWTKSHLVQETGENKLYIQNDEKYLYIMADIKNNATAPVGNFEISNGDNDYTYWYYYMSNGNIYFNGGECLGCIFKMTDNIAEFKVPLGSVMNLKFGTLIKYVRVFIQDFDRNWANIGDIKSGEIRLNSTFTIFSAYQNIYLKEHDDYSMKVETILDNLKYQWYFKDQIINGAVNKEYTIKNASSQNIGVYSVKVTSTDGIEKNVKICNILNVFQ